jgi:hypothetical protein
MLPPAKIFTIPPETLYHRVYFMKLYIYFVSVVRMLLYFCVWRENMHHDYAFMNVNTRLGSSNLSIYVRACLQCARTF